MARSYSIGLYKLSIRQARVAESQIDLKQNLSEEVGSFYRYFENRLIKFKSEVFGDPESDHYLRVKNVESTKYRKYQKVEGLLESGDNGFSATLLDVKKNTDRSKTKDEAELLPYYICLSETNDEKNAALCLQRFGNSGVLTTFTKFLREEFKKDFPSLIIDIEPFLPDFYIQKFINNLEVQEFKYTYLAPVGDAVTLLMNEGVRDRKTADVIIVTKVKPPRGTVLKIKDGVTGGINEMLSKISPKLDIDQRKILDKTITFSNAEGHKRTFSINRPENNALPYIDITNEVKRGLDGHPEYEEIKKAVEDILVESKLY